MNRKQARGMMKLCAKAWRDARMQEVASRGRRINADWKRAMAEWLSLAVWWRNESKPTGGAA